MMLRVKDGKLLCPACGSEYVHVTEIDAFPVGPAKQRVHLDCQGITLSSAAQAGGHGRGNTACVIFQCEDSHEFRLCCDFHKGETFIEHDASGVPVGHPAPTLWRD